jgi:hypothetical protein
LLPDSLCPAGSAFCKRLKLPNIRAYDQELFRVDQETKESRLKLATQRSKLENTYVGPLTSVMVPRWLSRVVVCRLKLEREHMDDLARRLTTAQASVTSETEASKALSAQVAALTAALETMAAERKQLKSSVRGCVCACHRWPSLTRVLGAAPHTGRAGEARRRRQGRAGQGGARRTGAAHARDGRTPHGHCVP